MIEIRHLSKRYGTKLAVDDISFAIGRGEILGLLGRNGAGKSTTMNIITGYLSASSGNVLLDGRDILDFPHEVKRHIGYLPEFPPLYGEMTVEEYLRFCCEIKEVRRNQIRPHVAQIVELCAIADHRHRLIKHLSKGYKQRVGMAQALIGNPDVIILDEPTIGLDPGQIIEMRNLIRELGKDHTVVLSSHILHEISDVCERVIIINRGRVVAQDSLRNLQLGASDRLRWQVRIAGDPNLVAPVLRKVSGVASVQILDANEPGTRDYVVESPRDVDVRVALFESLSKRNLPILMLRSVDVDLESIFLRLTADLEEVPAS